MNGETAIGSRDPVLRLFMAHRRKLLAYACGILGDSGRAEDVVQDAFLKFQDAAAARLPDEPVGYLYRVVRNLAFDRRRRLQLENRHMASVDEAHTAAVPRDAATPEQEVIARQDLQRVVEALAELPERTRVAVEMHRLGGCTLKEIAAHLGISVSMAHVLVAEGIRHCMSRL